MATNPAQDPFDEAVRRLPGDQREAFAQALRKFIEDQFGKTPAQPSRRLIPVPSWPKYHDYPTVPALRNLIFHEESNGFHRVLRRVGKRILIDEAAFFSWVDEQAKTAR